MSFGILAISKMGKKILPSDGSICLNMYVQYVCFCRLLWLCFECGSLMHLSAPGSILLIYLFILYFIFNELFTAPMLSCF